MRTTTAFSAFPGGRRSISPTQAELAFRDRRQVRGSLQADTFLTGLLVYRYMQGQTPAGAHRGRRWKRVAFGPEGFMFHVGDLAGIILDH